MTGNAWSSPGGIVVGVDASPAGDAALRWALREAAARRLPLTAVRAWVNPAIGVAYPVGALVEEMSGEAADAAQRLADERLKLALEDVPDGVETRAVALNGATAEVLVAAARDAALLVVGSRGAGALSRALLGSVSTSVLHHAQTPVVVVPEAGPADHAPARVLVGVDHSPESYAALELAVEQARRRGATLVPVQVEDPISRAGGQAGPPHTDPQANARHGLLRAAVSVGASSLLVEPEILVGHAGPELVAAARPHDLLVVGSRGRGGFAGVLLGSTSTHVAQHAPCPVLVVRR
jgi:nucleotide-binding universal stress UspA family protein